MLSTGIDNSYIFFLFNISLFIELHRHALSPSRKLGLLEPIPKPQLLGK